MMRYYFKKLYSPILIISLVFSLICAGYIGARAASTASISAQPSDITVYAGTPATVSVTASGTGTLSYQWYSNTKNSSLNGLKVLGGNAASYSPSTKIARTTYYYCVISQSDTEITCITSGIAAVIVKALPKITAQPIAATTYVDGIVTLSLTATGSSALTYQWYNNTKASTTGASIISDATNSSFTAPTTATETQYYFCVVTNTDNSISGTKTATVTSNMVKVKISEATNIPKITLQPISATVYAGVAVKLRIAAFGSGKLTYQWYSNTANSVSGSSEITRATSPAYSASTAADGTTYYYCIVTDTVVTTAGTQTFTNTSDIVSCKVNTGVNISLQPLDAAVYVGASVTLTVTATGNGTLKYQWFSNAANSTDTGTAISGATNNKYLAPTTTAGTLYYYCEITNKAAANTSAVTVPSNTARVKVIALPVITTQPTGAEADAGDTVSLSVAATGSGTLSYQWYFNTRNSMTGGSRILGATNSSYTAPTKTAVSAYYYCVVTNTDNSLTGTKTASVTSNSVAVLTTAVDITAPTVAKNLSSLTIVVGDTASLSLTVTGSGTLSYQWYNNTTKSVSGASAIVGATDASYTVPSSELGTKYYYCVVTNTDSSMPGIKSASATSNITVVTVLPLLPTITLQPTSSTIYCGTSYSLAIKALGSGLLSYQWYSNTDNNNSTGTAISGAISAKYTVPTTSAGTIYYYCVVTNTVKKATGTVSGTATSNVCSVVVADGPAISTQPEGATINSGEGLTLSVEASGSGKLTYQWYSSTYDRNTGGTVINGATSTEYKLSTTAASVTTTTYYFCVVTNTDSGISSGKSSSLASNTAKVIVQAANAAAPKITSSPTSQTVTVGSIAVLTVEATAAGTLSYQWYSSAKSSTIGGTVIIDATDSSYTITPTTAGITYYYCVVTNTDDSLSGTKTASATSKIAKVAATA